ncbi:MAG: hypothetical protein ACM33T_03220 [Solirubrobacterales bacterium]
MAVRKIVALLALMAPASAGAEEIKPYQSREIQPYQAKPVQPYRSQEVQPYQAKPVQPYQGGGVQQYQGGTVQRAPDAPAVRLFTPEERRQMMENDRKAGRTADGIKGNPAARPGQGFNPSPCAPNCAMDYSTGQPAPTLYNPNYNYSPFGR